MADPSASEDGAAKAEGIRKHRTPEVPASFSDDNEFREELPFHRQYDGLSYIGVTSRETWQVARHYHEHFELCYIDEGQGWFSIDGQLYQVQQGDLFLTKPGENHQGAAAGDRPYRLYYAGYRLSDHPKLEDDYYRIGESRVTADPDGDAKALFERIFAEIQEPQGHSALLAQSLFVQLLVQVVRAFGRQARPAEAGGTSITPLVKALLEELHESVGVRTRIGELADRHHLSRTHLEREFKRCVGIPLGQYMQDLCMERAKYWLRQPQTSVTETADRLGFSSIHAFSVFFKRHAGLSPNDFRKGL